MFSSTFVLLLASTSFAAANAVEAVENAGVRARQASLTSVDFSALSISLGACPTPTGWSRPVGEPTPSSALSSYLVQPCPKPTLPASLSSEYRDYSSSARSWVSSNSAAFLSFERSVASWAVTATRTPACSSVLGALYSSGTSILSCAATAVGSSVPRSTTLATGTRITNASAGASAGASASAGITSRPASSSAAPISPTPSNAGADASTSRASSSTSAVPTGAAVASFEAASSWTLVGAVAALFFL